MTSDTRAIEDQQNGAKTALERELAALWAALPLGQRSAAGTLRSLAESTGIDEAVLERDWREALLTEVARLVAAETGRQTACARAGARRSPSSTLDPARQRSH